MASNRERNTFNEINITPLTDIFLVLLIIMMVIAPLLDQQGLNLSVPSNVEAQDVKQENKLISVTVSDDDKYYISDVEISETELENTIKAKMKDFPEGMLILAQPDASHGAVVKLMDKARNAGITNISISD